MHGEAEILGERIIIEEWQEKEIEEIILAGSEEKKETEFPETEFPEGPAPPSPESDRPEMHRAYEKDVPHQEAEISPEMLRLKKRTQQAHLLEHVTDELPAKVSVSEQDFRQITVPEFADYELETHRQTTEFLETLLEERYSMRQEVTASLVKPGTESIIDYDMDVYIQRLPRIYELLAVVNPIEQVAAELILDMRYSHLKSEQDVLRINQHEVHLKTTEKRGQMTCRKPDEKVDLIATINSTERAMAIATIRAQEIGAEEVNIYIAITKAEAQFELLVNIAITETMAESVRLLDTVTQLRQKEEITLVERQKVLRQQAIGQEWVTSEIARPIPQQTLELSLREVPLQSISYTKLRERHIEDLSERHVQMEQLSIHPSEVTLLLELIRTAPNYELIVHMATMEVTRGLLSRESETVILEKEHQEEEQWAVRVTMSRPEEADDVMAIFRSMHVAQARADSSVMTQSARVEHGRTLFRLSQTRRMDTLEMIETEDVLEEDTYVSEKTSADVSVSESTGTPVQPPAFRQSLTDRIVVEGEKVRLKCNVTGYPQPSVVWYIDEDRITSSKYVQCECFITLLIFPSLRQVKGFFTPTKDVAFYFT